eukprot:1233967-Alexandrium_andersonii.AAC.1
MSASLVGSEMCIRDRPGPMGPRPHARTGPMVRVVLMPVRSVVVAGPEDAVSYTHLTLPTICSV